ncbi:MAG: sigma-70 family RNA polymerase sigma factor [Ignavibacteriaceae bacterium]
MTIHTTLADTELMQRVAASDSKALEILYNRYSPILYTVIKKIVSDEETVQQALADVFVIIWRKINYFDLNTNNPFSWLITLARNKAVDIVRRKRNPNNFIEYDEEYEDENIIPKLSSNMDPLDLKTALSKRKNFEEALNKLTDAQQYVIYLAFYEGYTEKEIASKLNIPIATVKSKIKAALINLRDNFAMEEA